MKEVLVLAVWEAREMKEKAQSTFGKQFIGLQRATVARDIGILFFQGGVVRIKGKCPECGDEIWFRCFALQRYVDNRLRARTCWGILFLEQDLRFLASLAIEVMAQEAIP